MRLIRFLAGDGAVRVGVLDGDTVTELAAAGSLGDLLALPLDRIREICTAPGGATTPAADAELLAPVDGRMEVWAAGVTYERSRTARMAESEQSADIYDRVYAAERPELFFKSAAWRVSGPGQSVSVRADSTIDVPEPELAVPGADEAVEEKQDRELVERALVAIPIERRPVFILYELEECPMKEIAELLAIPLFTAYSRLRVAREEFATAVRRLGAEGRGG